MPSRRLTVYLMSESVTTLDDAIDSEKSTASMELVDTAGIDGRFLYASAPARPPSWVSYLQPIVAGTISQLATASASGLLLLRTSGRVFAFTFGYGRSLLDLSKVEYQFGLRVALNRIDPRQIRSLDRKTFEDIVVTTNTQASRSADLPVFGVDISTDILRAVTGEPRDVSFAKRISGSDALVLSLTKDAVDLPTFCDDLLVAFGETSYRDEFAWIDQLALIRRSDEIDKLDDLLIKQLLQKDVSTSHLATPEAIGWEDIDEFKIEGTGRHTYDDLDLAEYLKLLGDRLSSLSIQDLRRRKVSVRFARSQEFDSRWTIYQCLVSEQRLGDQLCALIEGRWFRISESLVQEVDDYVASLPESEVHFEPAASGEQEGDYNKRLAASEADDLLSFDAKIKRPGGASSGIELCDLLASSGEFIHVKRKTRSSTLSHLFSQGSVSATTFLNDGAFRDALRDYVVSRVSGDAPAKWLDLIPASNEQLDRGRYRVTYAVITDSARPDTDWLPFFSKLNLMQHARQVRGLGLPVSLSRVPIQA